MSGVPVPVGPYYGALYFSAVLSVGFYGITCMQTFFYYVHYQDDQQWMKVTVAILWALDTMHEALIISGVYKYIITGLVNPLSFFQVIQEFVWHFLLLTSVVLPTQGYFVYRIYMFSNKKIIIPLMWIPLGLWELLAALLYIGKAAGATSITAISTPYFTDILIAYCVVTAVVDIAIALCLTYLLTRRRVANGFKSTAICAALTVVFIFVYPVNLTYTTFAFPMGSIYCNTLLANFNARVYIKNQGSAVSAGADLITDMRGPSAKKSAGEGGQSNELTFFSSTHQPRKDSDIVAVMGTTDATQSTKLL